MSRRQTTVKPDGKMEFKGRNGYAMLGFVDVWGVYWREPHTIYLDLYSKRAGDLPPARIQGTPEQVRKLLEDLLAAVNEIDSRPKGE